MPEAFYIGCVQAFVQATLAALLVRAVRVRIQRLALRRAKPSRS